MTRPACRPQGPSSGGHGDGIHRAGARISELSRTSVEVYLPLMISNSLDVVWGRSCEPGHLQTRVLA